jgi:hypothetical protein
MKILAVAIACAVVTGCATTPQPVPCVSVEESRTPCIKNLRVIDSAKEVASIKHGYKKGDAIPEEHFSVYIRGGFSTLQCPAGGRYVPHVYGEQPECTVHGGLSGEWRLAPEKNRKGISEQSLGGDSENRAEDGTVPGAPQG